MGQNKSDDASARPFDLIVGHERRGKIMEKQEWLDECAAHFVQRAKMLPEDAKHHAIISLEGVDGDLTESPQDAADEEMSNWAD